MQPLMLETMMLPQLKQDTCEKQNLKTDSNSCFCDLLDFMNSVNPLNSYYIRENSSVSYQIRVTTFN